MALSLEHRAFQPSKALASEDDGSYLHKKFDDMRTAKKGLALVAGTFVAGLAIGASHSKPIHIPAAPNASAEVLVESIPKPPELSENDFMQVFDDVFGEGSRSKNFDKSVIFDNGQLITSLTFGSKDNQKITITNSDTKRVVEIDEYSMPFETEHTESDLTMTFEPGKPTIIDQTLSNEFRLTVIQKEASGNDLYNIARKLKQIFDVVLNKGKMPVRSWDGYIPLQKL